MFVETVPSCFLLRLLWQLHIFAICPFKCGTRSFPPRATLWIVYDYLVKDIVDPSSSCLGIPSIHWLSNARHIYLFLLFLDHLAERHDQQLDRQSVGCRGRSDAKNSPSKRDLWLIWCSCVVSIPRASQTHSPVYHAVYEYPVLTAQLSSDAVDVSLHPSPRSAPSPPSLCVSSDYSFITTGDILLINLATRHAAARMLLCAVLFLLWRNGRTHGPEANRGTGCEWLPSE